MQRLVSCHQFQCMLIQQNKYHDTTDLWNNTILYLLYIFCENIYKVQRLVCCRHCEHMTLLRYMHYHYHYQYQKCCNTTPLLYYMFRCHIDNLHHLVCLKSPSHPPVEDLVLNFSSCEGGSAYGTVNS